MEMNTATVLTIEQILRAAQLLELQQKQQQQQQQPQQQQQQFVDPLAAFCKLGQDYENATYQAKIRGHDLSSAAANGGTLGLNNNNNSTGSSLRSSPHSSSPNSPLGVLLPANVRSSAKNSTAGVAPMVTCRSATNTNGPPSSSSAASSSSVTHSTRQSRAAHNELEKNRRANLRNYLEKLKSILPSDVESTRDTTLSLLTRARNHLRHVKQQKQLMLAAKEEALAENARLKARLEELKSGGGGGEVAPAQSVEQPIAVMDAEPEPPQQQEFTVPEITVSQQQQHFAAVAEPQQRPVPSSPAASSYMEFSPSAKPTSTLENALNALLNLNALQAALNSAAAMSTASNNALLNSALNTTAPLGLVEAGLQQQQQQASNALLHTPFRPTPIDLINEGLLPKLPLLYPYYTPATAQTADTPLVPSNGNMNASSC